MNARRAERTTGFSIDLGPGALHDFGPFRRVPAYHFRELLGRAARRLVPDLAEPRLEHWRDDRLVDRGIQLVDDGSRHSRRSDHAAPGRRVVARDSRLGDRRQVRKTRRAPRAAHRERLDLARARVSGNRVEALEHQLYVACDQVVDRHRPALVGYVNDLRAGHVLEELATYVSLR